MRIISGILKGRIINNCKIIGTRPTMDRVKESVFSMINTKITNSVVLDLFAGSGNYSIEAYSNGAKLVYANDINPECIKQITKNINNFNIKEKFCLTSLSYKIFLEKISKSGLKFDLVFLDPPYNMKVYNEIIYFLKQNNLLNNKAIVVCETDYILDDKIISNVKLIKQKKYGNKYVFIYENNL